jgi:hypothetical protein
MKKIILFLFLMAGLAGCQAAKKQYNYQPFYLLYHSDTRGYVLPCG